MSMQTEQETRTRTILAVDDAPENLQLINSLLRDRYRVKPAPDGKRALAIACSGAPPDLILLDVMMPGMDGFEVCRRLHQDPRTRQIPVIFLTAKDDAEHEVQGLETGAVDYLSKPIVPSLLKARVTLHLELFEARRRLAEQNRALNDAMKLREEIERITRHDLKGPLSGIITMSDVLVSDTTLGERQQEHLRIINRAGYRILEMIDRSLDLYKMETGRYRLNADGIDLVPTLSRIRRDQDRRMARQGLRLTLRKNGAPVEEEGENFFVWGEELLLYSLFSNLITNAIEASPQDAEITIDLTEEDEARRVSIHNSGVVPLEIRDRFFEKYATAGKENGTGLGTYSARLIARTHGGDITMTSADDQGTRVTVHLSMRRSTTVLPSSGRLQ